MKPMHGKIAVVTGASRGCGKGIALVLGEAGATVYVTGRSTKGNTTAPDRPETIDETAELVNKRGGTCIPVRCDHTKITDVKALYKKVKQDHGRIDILVNNAWGGYEIMVDFDPFWKIPLKHWDLMFTAGVRSHMLSSRFAVPLMIPQKKGLIVNTTAPVRGRYHGNVFYDTAKTAVNRMSMGMAHDLRTHGIAVIALAPGWMRTERVLQAMNTDEDNWTKVPEMEKTESPQYAGRAVLALATDEKVMEKTGQMHDVADLAREYGFKDIDGRQVPPIRELYPEYFAE